MEFKLERANQRMNLTRTVITGFDQNCNRASYMQATPGHTADRCTNVQNIEKHLTN
jgi:hypothetical protein